MAMLMPTYFKPFYNYSLCVRRYLFQLAFDAGIKWADTTWIVAYDAPVLKPRDYFTDESPMGVGTILEHRSIPHIHIS